MTLHEAGPEGYSVTLLALILSPEASRGSGAVGGVCQCRCVHAPLSLVQRGAKVLGRGKPQEGILGPEAH